MCTEILVPFRHPQTLVYLRVIHIQIGFKRFI